MKIKLVVETQSDKVGDEYLQQGEEQVELWFNGDKIIYFVANGTRYEIPLEVFKGILPK